MSKAHKSTEFSLHLSRSKMRKYLDSSLPQHEEKAVELHLKHCAHCSNIIVEYVELEGAENYKLHMAKLKGKLMGSVKPGKRQLSASRIKVFKAAAAVAALFVFSFFAIGSMSKKDFNFISDAGKKGNELPELKTNQKQVQKPKASTPFHTEKKTDEVTEQTTVSFEEDEEENYTSPVTKQKPQAKISPSKVVEQKPEEKIKETVTTAQVVEKKVASSSPILADAAIEKKENVTKREEEKEKAAEADEQDAASEKTDERVQPLQKIEKIDAGTQKEVLPEAQNSRNIPENGVGQLRQR